MKHHVQVKKARLLPAGEFWKSVARAHSLDHALTLAEHLAANGEDVRVKNKELSIEIKYEEISRLPLDNTYSLV